MLINSTRRLFLKASVSTINYGLAIAAGLVVPHSVIASWPAKAFDAKKRSDAEIFLFDKIQSIPSDKIIINAPDFAENGAMVPISVDTSLKPLDSITFFVSNNEAPLASHYEFYDEMGGYVSTRLKFKESAEVIVLVKAGKEFYSATKKIKVSIGGCGPKTIN